MRLCVHSRKVGAERTTITGFVSLNVICGDERHPRLAKDVRFLLKSQCRALTGAAVDRHQMSMVLNCLTLMSLCSLGVSYALALVVISAPWGLFYFFLDSPFGMSVEGLYASAQLSFIVIAIAFFVSWPLLTIAGLLVVMCNKNIKQNLRVWCLAAPFVTTFLYALGDYTIVRNFDVSLTQYFFIEQSSRIFLLHALAASFLTAAFFYMTESSQRRCSWKPTF